MTNADVFFGIVRRGPPGAIGGQFTSAVAGRRARSTIRGRWSEWTLGPVRIATTCSSGLIRQ